MVVIELKIIGENFGFSFFFVDVYRLYKHNLSNVWNVTMSKFIHKNVDSWDVYYIDLIDKRVIFGVR